MKSFLVAVTAFAAAVMAQSTTANTATTTHTLTPQESCISKCNPTDVTCQAICVGVPHPGDSQMNATTDCVAKCDQGDGSKEATDKYTACRNACISSYIITTGTAAPGGAYTTKVAPGQSTPSAMTTAASSSGSGNSSSASASARSSSSSGMAAVPTAAARLGGAAGTLGLVFAAFAML